MRRRWSDRAAAALLVTSLISVSTSCSGHETEVGTVPEVRGELVFLDVVEPVHGATLIVRLEDIGTGASEPVTITTQTHTGVSISSEADRIDFALRAPGLATERHFAVSAHLDVTKSGTVDAGDYRTTEPVPIDPADPRRDIEVTLRPVS